MYAGLGPARKKKPGARLPARLVMKLRRGKPCVKARIIVRLGTDSVNPFRQQIYKSLVSVALKPQNRTGCSSTECRWNSVEESSHSKKRHVRPPLLHLLRAFP